MSRPHAAKPDYAALGDEELLRRLRAGDADAEEALYMRYKPVVRQPRAHVFSSWARTGEDIIQEGMIGLYKAVCDYEFDKQASFRVFAELCITRQIITAIKSATRKKHIPLNTYVSLSRPVYDDGESERTLIDVLQTARVSDPEEALIGRESYEAIARDIETILSPLERQSLALYLQGLSYQQIGRGARPLHQVRGQRHPAREEKSSRNACAPRRLRPGEEAPAPDARSSALSFRPLAHGRAPKTRRARAIWPGDAPPRAMRAPLPGPSLLSGGSHAEKTGPICSLRHGVRVRGGRGARRAARARRRAAPRDGAVRRPRWCSARRRSSLAASGWASCSARAGGGSGARRCSPAATARWRM